MNEQFDGLSGVSLEAIIDDLIEIESQLKKLESRKSDLRAACLNKIEPDGYRDSRVIISIIPERKVHILNKKTLSKTLSTYLSDQLATQILQEATTTSERARALRFKMVPQ